MDNEINTAPDVREQLVQASALEAAESIEAQITGNEAILRRDRELARLRPLADSWRCFHCGDVFMDEETAAEHFGDRQDQRPGCVLKLEGAEIGLLKHIRQIEQQLISYMDETDEVAKYARHLQGYVATEADLREEEEKGYNKGVSAMSDLVRELVAIITSVPPTVWSLEQVERLKGTKDRLREILGDENEVPQP